ncbi:Soyasapogenol B glucuronide galactosyltransferase [Actinidia chinensis var. chinensis]|uniref:Soyasapogenol B glucuronide galactosyltransferase n=1 Tax=Actinidia chinensis var. chinensis TaxID=1590841 RepID=A0A2R6QGZ0_ACTCC|nr:Soyasapogenol B glucuronide galactosyltransferase [Actinidia chinensis var. chinensis]
MDSPSSQLEMFFLPFLLPGHLIPLFEIARTFAARGQRVTVIITQFQASTLQPTVDVDNAAGHCIALQVVPFPFKEVGLPDGFENFTTAFDFETIGKLFQGSTLLRPRIEELIMASHPDCLVSDMFHPWTEDLTTHLGIPRLHFDGCSMFFHSLEDAILRPDSPHWKVQSDYDPFIIPNLPDAISMTRSQLPDIVWNRTKLSPFLKQCKEAEFKSYGVLVNSFDELESAYTEYYKKVTGSKVFNIGPVGLIHRNGRERLYKGVVSDHEFFTWLNSKKPNSVLYICFGSGCTFPMINSWRSPVG